MSGPLVNRILGLLTQSCNGDDLLVFLGLLFRRRQAFKALQKLLFGHTLDGNFRIVGIDAGAG